MPPSPASTSFISFIASTMQTVWPASTTSPSSTNGFAPGCAASVEGADERREHRDAVVGRPSPSVNAPDAPRASGATPEPGPRSGRRGRSAAGALGRRAPARPGRRAALDLDLVVAGLDGEAAGRSCPRAAGPGRGPRPRRTRSAPGRFSLRRSFALLDRREYRLAAGRAEHAGSGRSAARAAPRRERRAARAGSSTSAVFRFARGRGVVGVRAALGLGHHARPSTPSRSRSGAVIRSAAAARGAAAASLNRIVAQPSGLITE